MRRLAFALAALTLATSVAEAQDAPAATTWWKPKAGTSFAIMLSVAPKTITTSATVVDVDLFDIQIGRAHV
jgi:hypothetical protein